MLDGAFERFILLLSARAYFRWTMRPERRARDAT
jgi:hypothetical protein